MTLALVALFAIGVPIGFAMALVAVLTLMFTAGAGLGYVIDVIPNIAYGQVTSYVFVCFPLFILMTEFMAFGQISKRLVSIAHKTMGRIPGSLAVVTVVTSTVFGAISGSAAIGAMAVSDMMIPETMERKYDKSLISGAIAAGGNLSIIIPPSFTFIIWGIISEESIGDLFMAGIMPGLLIVSMFIVYIMIRAKRNPALAPMPEPTSTKEKAIELLKGWDVALIIFIIIGGVYSGFATITEIAAVAAFATLIVTIVHRTMTISNFISAVKRAASMTCFFIIILIGAYAMIHAMGYMEIPQNITEWVVDADLSPVLLILAIQLLFFILGMFIDPGSVIMISLPLFIPALNALDINLIWLGVILAINSMIANLTPPVGINLYIVQGVGKSYGVSFGHVVRGTVPFILIMLVAMVLVIAFPGIATWLPSVINN